MKKQTTILLTISLAFAIMAAGCGSKGEGASTPVAAPETPKAVLSGMASKGPISGAKVNVYGIKDGLVDTSAAIGTGETVDGGSYSVNLGSYEGPVLVEVTGGIFTDEASGTTVVLKIPLHAVVSGVTVDAAKTVAVTPVTELAYKKAKGAGPLTPDSIDNANASVALSFGLKSITSVLPVKGGETDDQKQYAKICEAFSRVVNDNHQEQEPLEDALERILGKMDDEEEHGGDLSTGSAAMINAALAGTDTGTTTTADTTTTTTTPAFATGTLTLATVGIPFAMIGIDVTIALPLGVTVDFDRFTGVTAPGVVTISGVADFGNNNVIAAGYTPAFFGLPALLHIVMQNFNGFSLGEFCTIQFNVIPGGIFPELDEFIPVKFYARGFFGQGVTGVAAVPLSISGI